MKTMYQIPQDETLNWPKIETTWYTFMYYPADSSTHTPGNQNTIFKQGFDVEISPSTYCLANYIAYS